MSRATFYDPLYDFISFDEAEGERARGLFDPGFSTAPITKPSKSLLPFLNTPEMSRLAFLRQGDLSFLVFPSATHTRFAHSVGCCYLGYLAAREIQVTIEASEERRVFLSRWLEDRGLKEEFLLSLLLHDVGHFAFSHALENDKDLWDAIGGKTDHEAVACQFIEGKGEFFDEFWKGFSDSTAYESIRTILSKSSEIDPNIAAYLISGEESWIQDRDTKARSELNMLHELTSGLLDLDRIDHYRRDSYFSGMKVASNLNFAALLNGFNIFYSEDKSGGHHEVRLSKEAIGHALTLLHAKERLVHDCFENVDNLAYEVMLHHAFNYFCLGDNFYTRGLALDADLKSVRRFAILMLMMTDEELLLHMAGNGSERVKGIVRRLRNRRPYILIEKQTCFQPRPLSIGELRKELSRLAKVSLDDIVIRLGKHYGSDMARRPGEWLSLNALSDENGILLTEHDEYKRQIEHFKRTQDENPSVFWLFTPIEDDGIKDRLRSAMTELFPRPK